MKMLPETSSKEEEEANLDQWAEQDKIRKLAFKMMQREQIWSKKNRGKTSHQTRPGQGKISQ